MSHTLVRSAKEWGRQEDKQTEAKRENTVNSNAWSMSNIYHHKIICICNPPYIPSSDVNSSSLSLLSSSSLCTDLICWANPSSSPTTLTEGSIEREERSFSRSFSFSSNHLVSSVALAVKLCHSGRAVWQWDTLSCSCRLRSAWRWQRSCRVGMYHFQTLQYIVLLHVMQGRDNENYYHYSTLR